jgi:hypothetical protein
MVHASFQEMASYVEGEWAGMWFSPKCGDYVPFSQYTVFDGISCSGNYQHYSPGTYDMNGVTFRSNHIPTGTSVAIIKEGDPDQHVCRPENSDMRNLMEDIWPDCSSMWGTVGTMMVYSNSSCIKSEMYTIYLPTVIK